MFVSAIRAIGVTAVAAGVSVAGATLPAQAASTEGQVTTRAGLTVRSAPSTHAAKVGSIAYNKTFPIECKVRGTSVDGNDLWYSLPPNTNEWVSARYVRNVGPAPDWCTGAGGSTTGKTTAALTKRKGPTTADSAQGSLAKGKTFTITCKVRSQSVSGNNIWYFTSEQKWVSARYVTNVGAAPGYCTD